MPFDGKNFKPTIKPLQTGLAGMRQLADGLRWNIPVDFGWDFADTGITCGHNGCAMEVAKCLWPKQVSVGGDLLKIFKIPFNDFERLFGMRDTILAYGKRHENVTPHDVADAIDRYIERREEEGRGRA